MAKSRSRSTHPFAKTPADYRAMAKQRGFRWLGPEVPNIHVKTIWCCAQGHRWQASYNAIQQGHGCWVCAGSSPKTPADYRALARLHGFRWLGPIVPNAATKTDWQCAQGHRWQTTYSLVQQGYGCPICNSRRKTPADYHAIAKAHGLKWLGPEVRNSETKTTWQCARGHRWQTNYQSIQRGHGCHVCSGLQRKTPEDYRQIAAQHGLRWLGPEVSNTDTKTRWRCSLGHEWMARYSNLQQGRGCPICRKKQK
jgi:hypothetical protein